MTREPTERWTDEVPGTRWFRANLHLHTPDDPYVAPPPGIDRGRDDAAVLRDSAERFLDAAVAQGIEVLGPTTHATCINQGRHLRRLDHCRDSGEQTPAIQRRGLSRSDLCRLP